MPAKNIETQHDRISRTRKTTYARASAPAIFYGHVFRSDPPRFFDRSILASFLLFLRLFDVYTILRRRALCLVSAGEKIHRFAKFDFRCSQLIMRITQLLTDCELRSQTGRSNGGKERESERAVGWSFP